MKDKPALILLHGALGSKDQFSALKASLQDDFDVYTMNFEGHGGRHSDRDFSMDHFKENLLEFMEQNALSAAYIFGFSMGGYVALKFAMDHADKVKKIMTLATKFDWAPDTAAQEVSRLNPLKIEEKVPKFAEQLRKRHAPLDWHRVLSKTGAMMLALGEGGAAATEDFKYVGCPVLISVGSEDQMVSLDESQEIAQAIPEAGFYLFEGFKHPIEQADTQILAKRIQGFFSA